VRHAGATYQQPSKDKVMEVRIVRRQLQLLLEGSDGVTPRILKSNDLFFRKPPKLSRMSVYKLLLPDKHASR
jgi:hypothetical protein